jgi:hypothetical protein
MRRLAEFVCKRNGVNVIMACSSQTGVRKQHPCAIDAMQSAGSTAVQSGVATNDGCKGANVKFVDRCDEDTTMNDVIQVLFLSSKLVGDTYVLVHSTAADCFTVGFVCADE